MAAMQNLWVLCFALTSLYFLHKQTPYSIYLSILFGWMATFTSANGMMTFVAGGFVLLINRELFSKKNLIWLAAGGIAMASYFYHYTKPGYHPEIILAGRRINDRMGERVARECMRALLQSGRANPTVTILKKRPMLTRVALF